MQDERPLFEVKAAVCRKSCISMKSSVFHSMMAKRQAVA